MWHIIIVVSENRQIQQWWGLHFREILGRLFCCCERRRGKLACFQTVKRTRTRKTWNDGKWHTAEIALETAKKIVFWNKTRNCPENYSVLRKNFSSEVLFKLAGSQTSILCTACILFLSFWTLIVTQNEPTSTSTPPCPSPPRPTSPCPTPPPLKATPPSADASL